MYNLDSKEQRLPKDLSPVERVNLAKENLIPKGYQLQKEGECFVVSTGVDSIPQKEVNDIVNFLKPIEYWDLTGHCTQRSAEAVFSKIANYAYERPYDNKNSGVIPPGYHMIAGKKLENGKYLAFDPVSRAVIFSTSSMDKNPIAQTVFFYGDTEEQVIDMLNGFYGGHCSKVHIPDTPYERHVSKR